MNLELERVLTHVVDHGLQLHVHVHDDLSSGVIERLNQILTHIGALAAQVTHMDAATQTKLDALNTAVAQETTIEQSVETLLTGLSAQIAALKTGVTDPAVLAALDSATAIVATNNAKFAAAIAANTTA